MKRVLWKRRGLLVAVACLFVIAGFILLALRQSKVELPDGISPEQFQQASQTWQRRAGRPAERYDVLVQLGDKQFLEGNLEAAVNCYAEIPTTHPLYGPGARLEQAKALIRLNRAREAEHNLREFLQRLGGDQPVRELQVFEALDLLRFLLEVQLRFEERRDILAAVHDLNEGGLFETLAYCFPSVLRWNGPQATRWAEDFWQQDPQDYWLRIAVGRYRIGEGRLDEARALLEAVVAELPASRHAQAALLACYYEQDDWEAIDQRFDRLPPRADDEPWLLTRLRGHVHNQRGEYDEAIECFRAALARDPANAESYLGLATAYGGADRPGERAEALRKANVIARIQNRLGWALSKEGDIDALVEIADLCREIDLDQQAQIVLDFAHRVAPTHPALQPGEACAPQPDTDPSASNAKPPQPDQTDSGRPDAGSPDGDTPAHSRAAPADGPPTP